MGWTGNTIYIVTELLVNFSKLCHLSHLFYQLSKYMQLVLFFQKASSLLTKCIFFFFFGQKRLGFIFFQDNLKQFDEEQSSLDQHK